MKKLTTKEFITNATEIHKGKYDYSNTIYVNSRTPVTVNCPIHGEFSILANNHTSQRQGCAKCSNEKLAIHLVEKAKNTFTEKAVKIHGQRYDYVKVNYIGYRAKVTIICPIHGEFTQSPNDHLQGCGCPSCATYGFNPKIPGFLYYISINGGQAYKIGITNFSIEERFSVKELSTIKVIQVWEYQNGYECKEKEQEILKEFKDNKYKGSELLTTGNTELFNIDILGLDNEN